MFVAFSYYYEDPGGLIPSWVINWAAKVCVFLLQQNAVELVRFLIIPYQLVAFRKLWLIKEVICIYCCSYRGTVYGSFLVNHCCHMWEFDA
jgi:hypothetical protein